MSKVFVATIQVGIKANSVAEACDSISAIFTDNLRQDHVIVDWRYQPKNGVYTDPEFVGEFNLNTIDEGEIFNI